MNSAELGELFIQLAFQGNTEEAEKFKKTMNETAEAMQKAAKKAIESANSQKKDAEETKSNNKSKTDAIKALIGYITAISGAIFAIKKLTDSLIEENKTWLNLTRSSDIALSTFQKWDSIGKLYGVDGAAQSIKNLNDRLFELKLTGANAQGFMLAGIRPTNADDVMEQLRSRVSGLSDTSAAYLLRQMGLDENLLHILRLRRSEFKALNAEMKRFRLTDDQRRDIQKMNVQLQIAGQKIKYLKDRAILAIMPYVVEMVKSITRLSVMFAKAGKSIGEFVKKFRGIFVVIALSAKKFKPIYDIFRRLKLMVISLIRTIPIIGIKLSHLFANFLKFRGLGALLAKAFLPLTALYLLLDDLAVFLNGGDSLIGEVIKNVKEAISDFVNIFKAFNNGNPLYAIYATFVKLADIVMNITRAILRIFDIVFGTPFAEWFDKIKNRDNYQENIDNLRENLKILANPTVSTSNLSNTYNRSTGNYAPVYNITIDSPEGQQILQNFQKNDFAQANLYFAQAGGKM